MNYWTEEGYDRTELLGLVIAYLNERGWGKAVDSGWEDWDLAIYCHPWTVVQVATAQEEHGGNKKLIRVRYRLRNSGYAKLFSALAIGFAAAAVLVHPAHAAVSGVLLATWGLAWFQGTRRAAEAVAVVDGTARQLNLIWCTPDASNRPAPAAADKEVGR